MGYFYYEFDPSYKIEKKVLFPQNFKHLKMGTPFFRIILGDKSFAVDKIMITNYPNLDKPAISINYVYLSNQEREELHTTFTVDEICVPRNGQKKDTIRLSSCVTLCTTKQAVYKLLKGETSKYFGDDIYLNQYKWTNWQKELVEKYKRALEKLKTL